MFVFVSDMFSVDYPGGAELTTQALIDYQELPIIPIRSSQLTIEIIDMLKDRYWIFGNFAGLGDRTILECAKKLTYSVIEYDYKYCSYRLPEKHKEVEGMCGCEVTPRGKLVSVFFGKAKSLWFMSHSQKEKYCKHFPFLKKETTRVLSSVFSKKTLEKIEKLRKNKKEDILLIQDSNSWVKGTSESIAYAKSKNLKYQTFSGLDYDSMLDKFSKSRGFIFLPLGPDTCPRTVIEAKLLGCELILNENVEHKDEHWFTGSIEDTFKYLSERTEFFWKTITASENLRLPKKKNIPETTHFKIIIPVYNAEKWIEKCINSVTKQDYSNYECIISDDMSTDQTYSISSRMLTENVTVKRTNQKKYALKNIYDSIETLSPEENDVVIILDGDDWFSNECVLATLNEYYQNSDCLMTYGSFVRFPDGAIGQESSDYPKHIVENNLYREDVWRASHLKTFRHLLWKNIEDEDLKDRDGNFYEISYDQAIMLPMLEMAGSGAKYVPEVLCVYNTGNPNSVNRTRQQRQYETMLEIRSKRRYERIKK